MGGRTALDDAADVAEWRTIGMTFSAAASKKRVRRLRRFA
jgi:hypothetical protein